MREATHRLQAAGARVYAVGGSLRDEFIEAVPIREPDRDFLVTGLTPSEIEEVLRPLGEVTPAPHPYARLSYRPHGHQGEAYDLALPARRTPGRPPEWDPELPVEEDLRQRDFGMNALARDLATGELIDPCDGQADLLGRRVRMTSAGAFEVDPVRMVRACAFAARFRFWIEDETFQQIRRLAPRIQEAEPGRVFAALAGLLTLSERPSVGLKALQRLGVLQHILPELVALVGVEQPKKFHVHDAFDHTMVCVDAVPSMELVVRLAALLHDIGKAPTARFCEEKDRMQFLGHENVGADLARRLLLRLDAPRALVGRVERLVRCHMFSGSFHLTPAAVRRLMRRVGRENIHALIDLRVGDRIASGKANLSMGKVGALRMRVEEELREPEFDRSQLAVTGNDLMEELGLRPGPEIGRLIGLLLEAVLEDPSTNCREALLLLARSHVAREAARTG